MGTFTLESEGGYRDIAMLEKCDEAVHRICEACEWTKEFNRLIKSVTSSQLGAVEKTSGVKGIGSSQRRHDHRHDKDNNKRPQRKK